MKQELANLWTEYLSFIKDNPNWKDKLTFDFFMDWIIERYKITTN